MASMRLKLNLLFLLTSVVGCLAGYRTCVGYVQNECHLLTVIKGVVFLGLFAISAILLDIIHRNPSDSHDFHSLISQYKYILLIQTLGWWEYRRLVKTTQSAAESQEKILNEIVQRCKDTEYGRKYDFENIRNIADYRRKVPMSTYENYREYVDRIYEYDTRNVLFPGPALYFILTSGTTGKNKRFPYSIDYIRKCLMKPIGLIPYSQYKRGFKSALRLQKVLDLYMINYPKINSHGRKEGSLLSTMRVEEPFNTRFTCMFGKVIKEADLMYLLCRISLLERELEIIRGSFPTVLASFINTMEQRWEELCDDIEHGTLTKNLEISGELRQGIQYELQSTADMKRAEELRQQFRRGFNKILPRIWPRLEFISQICSGSYKTQGDGQKRMYCGEQVDMGSYYHGGTEGFYGILMAGVEFGYVPAMTYGFFEFIPVADTDSDDPSTMLVHQLVKGEEYEMVVTGWNGLYRYRTGDVIQIIGYFNQAPVYEFQSRLGQLLNLIGEKTPEGIFHSALEKAIRSIGGLHIVEYTATENIYWEPITGEVLDETNRRYYVLFIEVKHVENENPEHVLTEEEKAKFDESLVEIFEKYRQKREPGTIKPMEVIQVKSETFHKLKQLQLKLNPNATSSQFKQRRASRDPGHLKLLYDNILSS